MVMEKGRLDVQIVEKRSFIAFALVFLLAGCSKTPVDLSPSQIVTTATGAVPTRRPTTTPPLIPTTLPYRTPTETPTVTPAVTAAAVAAGKNHTCAILSNGAVKCWGNNEHGQLGNGGDVNSNIPVDVTGVRDATAITAGWGHTCILSGSGGVKCWGYNKNGELGNGTTQDSNLPVDVIGLSTGAVAIDAGDDHTCAVTNQGRVMCWGYNEYGQLGDGTTVSRSIPVEAQGFADGIAAVTAGWGHTCALTDGGGVKCWGNNQNGQLGYGQDAEYRLTAVDVLGLGDGAIKITADGGSACALVAGGGVKCWGSNKYGQLGDDTAEDRRSPVEVGGLSAGVVQVAAGWNHTCAVTGNGEMKCWGWNYYGQLGDGTKTSRTAPVRVAGLTDGVVDIGVGWGHTCVVTELGGVRCWGANENGQLGDGTNIDSVVPMAVMGISSSLVPLRTHTPTENPTVTPAKTYTNTFTITPTKTAAAPAVGAAIAVTSTQNTTCALTSVGGVKCWGENSYGQIGDGTTENRSKPVYVSGLSSGVTALVAGSFHTCALTTAGGVKCWGNNGYGDLGDGTTTDRLTPVDVIGLSSGVTALAAGASHTCALMASGGVKCWGWNRDKQLGDGTTTDRLTPVDVAGLSSGVTALVAGVSHTCALMAGGGVKCWGWNLHGQIGDGTTTDRLTPVDVSGLSSGVTALAAGAHYTCALTAGGGVKCWGYNWIGQIGDGTTTDRLTPVDVSGLSSGVAALAAGVEHTCALTAGSGVKCWGSNAFGELGDGTTMRRSTPVDERVLSSGVSALAAGYWHTCALTSEGGIKCWGNNYYSQLGNGTATDSIMPVDVIGFGGTEAPISQPTLTPTPTYPISTWKTYTITPTPR